MVNHPVCLSYFSAMEQCFPLTTFQYKHELKPNFSIVAAVCVVTKSDLIIRTL
jgi:hypothetical protein